MVKVGVWFYDWALPLEVYPLPGDLARVGVILKECPQLEVDSK
jgi:hypothetical protein